MIAPISYLNIHRHYSYSKSVLSTCTFFHIDAHFGLKLIRFFFGDTFGTCYLIIGPGILLLSVFIAVFASLAGTATTFRVATPLMASVVAAFPIGAVIVMIAVSFLKDVKNTWRN